MKFFILINVAKRNYKKYNIIKNIIFAGFNFRKLNNYQKNNKFLNERSEYNKS